MKLFSIFGRASRNTSKEKGYTNQELDPWIKARIGPAVDRAYGLASQPFQRYGGQRVAGFNPTQTYARGMALGAAGVTATPRATQPAATPPAAGVGPAPSAPAGFGNDEAFSYDPSAAAGADTLNEALAATRGVLGMRPDEIVAPRAQVYGFGGARLGAAPTLGPLAQAGFERFGGARLGEAAQAQRRDIAASVIDRAGVRDAVGGRAADGMDRYMNRYLDDVVTTTLADVERQRGVQQAANDPRAAAARAFGSRSDVAAGETNRAAIDASARTAAELRARGFDVALGASQEDMARALQAQIANIGSDLTVLGRNQDATMQERLANQADTRTVNLANMGERNRFALQQADYEQQAGINNSNLSAQTSIFNTGQTNEGRFRDGENRMRYGLAQADHAQQAGLATLEGRNRGALADQAASLAAQTANQRAGLDYGRLALGAGAQLGGLSGVQRQNALGNAAVVAGLGQEEQALEKAHLDALYEMALQEQQWPFLQQQMLNGTLGLLPTVLDTDYKKKGSGASLSLGFQSGRK